MAADTGAEFGFLLHDVGKVAVPDAILHKPSALTPSERDMMRWHPVAGWEILSDIDFLSGTATDVVRHHHERWDGRGYPDRLAGDDIPRVARIFAVADAFDAITTDRPYRTASPIADARLEIARSAGSQFDPEAAEAFMDISLDLLAHIRDESDLTSVAAP